MGDGFQRAAFGFFQGAVQRGAGSLGMSAAAQQAAGFGGVDACAGTQADFALAAGQFTDRLGTVHAFDYACHRGDFLGIVRPGADAAQQRLRHGDHGNAAAVMVLHS